MRLRDHEETVLEDRSGSQSAVIDGQDPKDCDKDVGDAPVKEEHPRFTLLQSTDTNEGRHPGRKISYGGGQKTVMYEYDLTPSALSPTGERSPIAYRSRIGSFPRF